MEFTYYNEKLIGQMEYGFLPISPNAEMGYRPMELFVSSLTGCSTSVLANILDKKRIDYKRIDVNVSAVRNPEEANRIERLTFDVAVQTDTLDKAKQAEKIAALVLKNCGMIQSVIGSIDIRYQIEFTSDQPKKGDVA
ncbi:MULTISPECIES: OsmC family protein [Bacillaceae]|uniref:OsmC family protein n=1 Tax=Bacillaceae TaxID=186817 RepID=UPI0011A72C39|nr:MULTISPECIES: OsmC family protein [Bacillaceae]MCM3125135.1 OsmC family protein [Mesobacillus sp. MER 33]MCM3235105.1 OsmC family protein [Mesobacillus sp. MER 48]